MDDIDDTAVAQVWAVFLVGEAEDDLQGGAAGDEDCVHFTGGCRLSKASK